jgi:hypothetical protein
LREEIQTDSGWMNEKNQETYFSAIVCIVLVVLKLPVQEKGQDFKYLRSI